MGAKRLPDLRLPADAAVLAYLAGIVDGEGSISISSTFAGTSRSRSHSLRVTITNTSERLMAWLVSTLGGGLTQRRDRNAKWAVAYSWTLHAHQAEAFLQAIEPYLLIKKEQAEVALMFRSVSGKWKGRQLDPSVVERREQLKQRIHVLNRRGAVA